MKISFAIGTHNEGFYISELLNRLFAWLDRPTTKNDPHEYEIVILDDHSTDTLTTAVFAKFFTRPEFSVYHHALNDDFAAHKNYMNSLCTGDWIFNLDADEYVTESFLDILPLIIESNPEVEAFWLPRVNTVSGLTLQHVQKWHWVISTLPGFRCGEYLNPNSEEYKLLKAYNLIITEEDEVVVFDQPIINWPDPQMRLYKNDPRIKWEGKVHERVVGFTNYSLLPTEVEYAIRHHKNIQRQEEQNNYYETLA